MQQATKRMIEDLVNAYADTHDQQLMETLFLVVDGELRFQSTMTAVSAVIEHINETNKHHNNGNS